jgi:hypothetical protein
MTKICPKSGIKKAVANWQKMPRANPEKDLPSLYASRVPKTRRRLDNTQAPSTMVLK